MGMPAATCPICGDLHLQLRKLNIIQFLFWGSWGFEGYANCLLFNSPNDSAIPFSKVLYTAQWLLLFLPSCLIHWFIKGLRYTLRWAIWRVVLKLYRACIP